MPGLLELAYFGSILVGAGFLVRAFYLARRLILHTQDHKLKALRSRVQLGASVFSTLIFFLVMGWGIRHWGHLGTLQLALSTFLLVQGILFTFMIWTRDQTIRDYRHAAEYLSEEAWKKHHEIESFASKMTASARLAGFGEMASSIAHEINNPLAIILGRVELMRMRLEKGSVEQEEVHKTFVDLEGLVNRVARIVRTVQSFAREGDSAPFQMVALETVVEDALLFCVRKFRAKGVELRVPAVRPNLMLECRPVQISQVLLNLLGNALDAVELLPEKWVSIDIQEKGAYVLLMVTDSGGGIPPAVREKMMHPFFTTKAVGKGTGLGLPICQRLVEGHGGNFFLDDKHQNTRFVLLLPLRQPAAMEQVKAA